MRPRYAVKVGDGYTYHPLIVHSTIEGLRTKITNTSRTMLSMHAHRDLHLAFVRVSRGGPAA